VHLRTCSAEDLYIERMLCPLLELKEEPENWGLLLKLRENAV